MKKTILSLLTVLLAAPSAQALQTPHGKGKVTNPQIEAHTIRYIIEYKEKGKDSGGICTGTFISSRTLITAAHCVPSNPIKGMKLTVFNYQNAKLVNQTEYSASQFDYEEHPLYAATEKNDPANGTHFDVALIHFEKPVFKGVPARLGDPKDTAGEKFLVVGAGTKEYWRADLLKIFKQIANQLKGDLRWATIKVESKGTRIDFTTPFRYKVCGGDSGGPLMAYGKKGPRVIGVVSRGLDLPDLFKKGQCGRIVQGAGLSEHNMDWVQQSLIRMAVESSEAEFEELPLLF